MIVQKLEEIVQKLCDCKEDTEKTEAGNVSAGRRVRKASMEIINDLKELRKLILENSKK
tara:strand:- start:252 stop:428 length:177 start_codon:yes stop_codon:yes gene_type:complete